MRDRADAALADRGRDAGMLHLAGGVVAPQPRRATQPRRVFARVQACREMTMRAHIGRTSITTQARGSGHRATVHETARGSVCAVSCFGAHV
eukprot:7160438-Prymnesium_polylepis.2